ncbi:MAG: hypothetical protein K2X27_01550 [Candidatus Obscuribacterales bacterium]|nr:hypothetical protein [Candidatus Obscuribacterales bacterium]
MNTVNPKTKKAASRKKSKGKKADSVLSICPVNGAGWCPYPFSAAQLKKRLKRKQEEEQEAAAGKAK